jgi:aminopeptidase
VGICSALVAGPMKPEELARYADAIVRGSIAFKAGDVLVVECTIPERELAVALAESAYRAGAHAVEVLYEDPQVHAAQIRYGRDDALGALMPWDRARGLAYGTKDVARVIVRSNDEQEVVSGLPVERVSESARRARESMTWVWRQRAEARQRYTICAWPTPEWSARIFGGDPGQAQRKLGRDLLSFCRLGPDDPPGYKGWTQHLAELDRRARRLTKLGLREVQVRDRGVDLRLSLPPTAVWEGGGNKDYWGRKLAMNIPTEECFVSPDAAATEGTFRCSRPRAIGGRVIDGLAGEFRGGRLVRLDAKRRADRDWLATYIGSFPNLDRLGEIALVDSTSRIGATGRTYYNALLDENAVAHMAFGYGFEKTRSEPMGRSRQGVNKAALHIDVMIGTDDLEAVGVTAKGRRVPLVRDGLWQI